MSSDVLPSSRRHWRGDLSASPRGYARQPSSVLSYCMRLVADAIILNMSLVLALMLHYLWVVVAEADQLTGVQTQQLAQHHIAMYFDLAWIVTLIGLTALWLGGLYTYARRYRIRYKVLVVAQAVTFGFGLSVAAVFLSGKVAGVQDGMLLMAWTIAVVLIVTSRVWSAVWRHLVSNEGWSSDPPTSELSDRVRDASWRSDTASGQAQAAAAASGQVQAAREASQRGDTTTTPLGQAEALRDANGWSHGATPMHLKAARLAPQRHPTAAAARVEKVAVPNGADATGRCRIETGRREKKVLISEKTVLIIGGAGYIGSALLPKILQQGYRVRVLDLFLYGFGPIAEVLDDPAVEIIRADFRQIDALVRAMQGVEHVVHLGGIVGDPACAIDEELTIDVNVAATRLVGEVAKGNGIKHFLFASTCSVYGASEHVLSEKSALNPLSLYARSKMASEQVLLSMADDTFTPTILRFGTIYGLSGRTRFDLVVNVLAAKAAFEGRITVFGGGQWRPFLHVDDAALAVSRLLNLPPGRGADVFNVGSNHENYTIAQVGEIVKSVVPEAELTLAPGDRDQRNYRGSFSKIKIMVDFEPLWTVETGVRQIVNAIRDGKITDYHEVRYSNEKYLSEMNGNGLAPPQVHWAHDLVRQPAVPVVGAVR